MKLKVSYQYPISMCCITCRVKNGTAIYRIGYRKSSVLYCLFFLFSVGYTRHMVQWCCMKQSSPEIQGHPPFQYNDPHIHGFHSIFSLGNWRALHHHAACCLYVTGHFCPPVSMVKDAMESIYLQVHRRTRPRSWPHGTTPCTSLDLLAVLCQYDICSCDCSFAELCT